VDTARIRSLYDGEVLFSDVLFGNLIRRLNELGMFENSIIILTSDHGEEFREHGGFQHGRLFEEHLRIPLLIYHPAIRKMERNRTPVSNLDLLPTLLHAAGISRDWDVDGRNLLEPAKERGALISLAMTAEDHRAASILENEYKLIVSLKPDYSEILFDLEADPGETANLAPDHPERVKALIRALRRTLGEKDWGLLADPNLSGDPREGLDTESIEALKELGYLTE